jgi:SOS-response transcriptional repressor LexA
VLAAANPQFSDIPIDPEEGVEIWGVVTWSLTRLCAR